ncbi:two pore calcium channel protein 1-like [Actinia tenebrosa]|uniref:Two pore calcium channel protein 1-like n=1 Tax=Actinia tenebrosa TaxID=6105 RepID=A0A6P8HA20_ACTTE|nr:two pore calcium channel protein 1-like [Actinia tenebrosa]
MEGIVHSTSDWSRIYFMMFFIIIMVVMTIVVAFILQAFSFKIKYRKEHPDKETDIKTEVEVSYEELMALDSKFCVGLEPGKPVRNFQVYV